MVHSRLDTDRKRYLLTNKPGHPDSYVTVITDFLIAPFMLLFSVGFTTHAILDGGLTLSNSGRIIGSTLFGAVAGMFASVVVAMFLVACGVFLAAIAVTLLTSVNRIRDAWAA